MAAVNFDVDTDNLRAGVRDMREQLSAMKEGRDALATSVAEVESTWEGPAKEQFSSQFLRDCEEFDSIYKTISEILDRFDRAATEYDTCDAQVLEIINAMRGGE